MQNIYRYSDKQPIVWYRRRAASSNQYCLYCGQYIGQGSSIPANREHLIAREFVPKDTLDEGTAFNFIFGACKRCNAEKANAERHVSSITLLTSPARAYSPEVNAIAVNKASKDFHPLHPGKTVGDSIERLEHHFDLGPGVGLTVGTVSPPQLDPDAVGLLAFRHMQGFVSLITSVDPTTPDGTSILLPDNFSIFGHFAYSDWGDVQLVEVVQRTAAWEQLAHIETANGFFKAIIKKDPLQKKDWYWALEWNKSVRVVGVLRSTGSLSPLFGDLPPREWSSMRASDGCTIRIKMEHEIAAQNDKMFREQEST